MAKTVNTTPIKQLKPLKTQGGKLDHAETDFADDVKARAQTAQEHLDDLSRSTIAFPYHAFPEVMQNLLKVFYDSSGFAPEYYFSNLLSVAALCTANKFKVKAKSDFYQPAVLYLVNVGKSGLGKSGPQKTIFRPIEKKQTEEIKRYNDLYKVHVEAEKEALANKEPYNGEAPILREILFEVSTLEAMYETLKDCQYGSIVKEDEMTGWLGQMGQYSNKSDPEISFWLKNYDNPLLYIIKRKSHKMFLYNIAVNINGNIQDTILPKLASGPNKDNGFLQRFNFTLTSKTKSNRWTEIQPDQTVFDKYEEIISFLYDLPSRLPRQLPHIGATETINLPLSAPAKELYVKFYNLISERMDGTADDSEFSQLSKFKGVCLRFSLVMEMLFFACDMYDNDDWNLKASSKEKLAYLEKTEISERAMQSAIALTEYYIQTAMEVLGKLDTLLNTYKPEVRAWYRALPDSFNSAFARELGETVGLGTKRTIYRYLDDKNLFKKNHTDNVFYKIITI
jgi:hypothetical protein